MMSNLLVMVIIGISSIHLLRTFITAGLCETKTLMWQTIIHLAFLLSAMAIAASDRIMPQPTRRGAGASADH